MEQTYLQSFFVAGFTYYDGALIFNKLKIGKKLNLKLEEDNKYDHRAVAIYYKENKIGFIPRTENRIFHKMLKIGLEKNIRVLVQRVQKNAQPENQVQVVVHLVKN